MYHRLDVHHVRTRPECDRAWPDGWEPALRQQFERRKP